MTKRIFSCAAVIAFYMSFSAFASSELNLQYAENLLGQNTNYYECVQKTQLYDSRTGLLYQNADPVPGYACDMNGELYYSDNWQQVGYMFDSRNQNGIAFDRSGKMINPVFENSDQNQELSKLFEEGKTLSFSNKQSFLNFMEYYIIHYRLNDSNGDYSYSINNDEYTIKLDDSKRYDREKLKAQIRKQLGPLVGNTDYEKILYGCKLFDDWNYDLNYDKTSLQQALTDKTGVCSHYVKILSVLLEDAGIEYENMAGKYINGQMHTWLRCRVDGKWVYVDPTIFKICGLTYSNINYMVFIQSYNPIRYIQLKG